MQRIIRFNNRYLKLMLINLLIFILIMFVGVNDCTNDDFYIQQTFLPQNGSIMKYHHIVNIFWTIPCYWLQNFFPNIAWHFTLQIIGLIVAINIIAYEVLCKLPVPIDLMSSLLVAYILYLTTIQNLNFTKTTIAIISAGIVVIFHEYETLPPKMLYFVKAMGMLFIVIGCQLRFETIALMAGPMLPLLYYLYLQKKRKKEVFFIVIAIGIAVILQIIGTTVRKSDLQWNEFLEQFELVQQLHDYPLDTYSEASELYEQIGLNDNDVNMIKLKIGSDPFFFNTDRMDKLTVEVSHKFDVSYLVSSNIKNSLRRIIEGCAKNWIEFVTWTAIIVAFILFQRKKKIIVFLSILSMAGYFCFFAVMGRIANWVIDSVFIVHGVVILICSHKQQDITLSIKAKRVMWSVFLVAFLIPLVHMNSLKIRRTVMIDNNVGLLSKEIGEDVEHLYLFGYGLNNQFRAVQNLLIADDYYNISNSIYLNHWYNAPYIKKKLEAYGVSNIYNDSVDSNIIRFILNDNDVVLVEKYIRDHYENRAFMELDHDIFGYKIYRVVTK